MSEGKDQLTRFDPINDGVLVSVELEAEKTKGGIYLPDMARRPMHQGKVVALGPGRVLESGARLPMTVPLKDAYGNQTLILFGAYSGTEIKVDGEPFRLMREIDVLGVLRPKTPEQLAAEAAAEAAAKAAALASLDVPAPDEAAPEVVVDAKPLMPTSAEMDAAVSDLVGATPPTDAPKGRSLDAL